MTLKQVRAYVALVIAISWGIQLPAILLLGIESSVTRAIFVLVMWSPTLLALVFMARVRAARVGLRWRLGRLRFLPVGIGVETLVAFAMLGGLMAAGAATSGWFRFGQDGVSIVGGPWVLGLGSQDWLRFVFNVAATAIVYSVVGLVATTGEEFAWRGFLQGHLERRHGVMPAIMRVAVIWWAWHLPGLVVGYNFPETPILGAFVLFPVQMLGTSLFFGWLTIRSNSFWPAALAHATVNSLQQGIFDNLQLSGPALDAHVVRTILIAAVGVLSWFGLRSMQRRDGTTPPIGLNQATDHPEQL